MSAQKGTTAADGVATALPGSAHAGTQQLLTVLVTTYSRSAPPQLGRALEAIRDAKEASLVGLCRRCASYMHAHAQKVSAAQSVIQCGITVCLNFLNEYNDYGNEYLYDTAKGRVRQDPGECRMLCAYFELRQKRFGYSVYGLWQLRSIMSRGSRGSVACTACHAVSNVCSEKHFDVSVCLHVSSQANEGTASGGQQGPAEHALRAMLLHVDADAVYRAALGLYELPLAFMVITHAQVGWPARSDIRHSVQGLCYLSRRWILSVPPCL